MPENHCRRSIGSLCEFVNGNGFRPTEWSPSGLPIIRIQNLNGSQNFNYFNGEPKPKWLVQPGDLLFAWAGVKGVSFGPTIWPGPQGVLNQHIFRVVPKEGVDKYWLYLALQVATRRIESNAHGFKASLVHVQKDDITTQVVDLPPLHEQQKIAEVLRKWDEALEKLASLRESKLRRHRELTKALVFGSWQLEKFRTTNEVAHYRWFQLPASWNCQQIGELSVEISERNGEGDQHEVLSCSKHEGFVRSLEYFKKQIFSSDLTGYKKIWRGDFGFPSNHIEEGSIGLQNLADTGVVSPIYTVFRFNPDEVLAEYAFAVLKTELYRHIFEISTSASVDRRGSLRWSEFSRIPFPVPPLAEQEAIAEVLRASRRELDSLRDEIDAVTRQKRGLMQKLLTGVWRVSC
ncbi:MULTISPECIES: restriction endonuclease subunit S [unclassified Halomonas]|uniref:restriction endonuclease subunit S n=1 Tax=unclassified Halomonas TaxID=2609666 RepID=UPI00209E4B87|nr:MULTISPECIES: restriction endonuclease subunit S [unclassified Halomonas]MCP1313456.1 restriction endonuclease subunit S [Halomonas sp. 707D7]MCP1326626.1 restriction endonuclease subunit S [Halomonas sp. 707D4]